MKKKKSKIISMERYYDFIVEKLCYFIINRRNIVNIEHNFGNFGDKLETIKITMKPIKCQPKKN